MMKKQEWGWDGDLGHNGNERLCQSMATHSSVLAWRILWTEEPGGLLSIGSYSQTRLKQLSMHACVGEGNGNPLQCSCLENTRDGGAW